MFEPSWGVRPRLHEQLARWLPTGDLRRLVAVRALRSFIQGYSVIVFAIYLGQVGFSPWLIGATLAVGNVLSAVLTLTTGVLSDRFGRRPFLLLYGGLMMLSGLIFSVTTVPLVLIAVSAFGALGRGGGAGGQAGPFAPAEQAFLAEKTTGDTRRRVFTVNNAVGTLLAAMGALFAGVPDWLRAVWHLSLVASYRPLYLGVAVVGACTLVILWPVTESPRKRAPRVQPRARGRRKSYGTIGKISLAGAVNGLGMSFIGGILPYWLHVRYGVLPGAIGPVMAISSLLTALLSLVAARLAARYGDVLVITGSRLLGVLLTVALPFAPIYPIAAVLVVARMVSGMMAMPIRQSYTMGILEPELRGSAAGISGVARRLPASVAPALSGYWIGLNELELPFFASGLLMFVNGVLYYVWFHAVRPLDEQAPADASGG